MCGSFTSSHATVAPVNVDMSLNLTADPVELTAALVDVPSVSGEEAALADAVQAALAAQAPHLQLLRSGNTVLARTHLGRPQRVLLAGHLDTVPVAGPPAVSSRRAARAPCELASAPAVVARTVHGHGWGTTRSTPLVQCCPG
jgi:hypothetical protein